MTWFSRLMCACALSLFVGGSALAQEEPIEPESPGESPSPGEQPPIEPSVPAKPQNLDGPEQVRLPISDPPWSHWFVDVEDDAPLRGQDTNFGEHSAYNFTLAFAREMDTDLMIKHAEKVPLVELIQPIHREYQNKLIHFEGRVRRLTQFDATRHLRETDKIKTIYEAWIVPKGEPKPVCYLFTELPEGMETNLGGKVDYYVAFEGYYFKLMHYDSAETKENGSHVIKRAPLLVGKTLRLIPAPERADSLFLTPSFAILMFVIFGSIVATGLGFLWWFRRTDRRVQAKLDAKRNQSNPFTETSALASNPGDSGQGSDRPPGGDPRPPGPYLN